MREGGREGGERRGWIGAHWLCIRVLIAVRKGRRKRCWCSWRGRRGKEEEDDERKEEEGEGIGKDKERREGGREGGREGVDMRGFWW